MIIVSGCSWACGEWQMAELAPPGGTILHQGLSQYIADSGLEVINLGIRAGSNLQVCDRIESWILNNPDVKIDKIIVLQTEYTRDLFMNGTVLKSKNNPIDCDWSNMSMIPFDFSRHDSLRNLMLRKFYERLSDIVEITDSKVYLIGGLCDTMTSDFVESCFAIKVACQSMINLLINDQPDIENPVFSLYHIGHLGELDAINQFKRRLSSEESLKLLTAMQQGVDRAGLLLDNPQWFRPDGWHPNRHGHKKLFDYLVREHIL